MINEEQNEELSSVDFSSVITDGVEQSAKTTNTSKWIRECPDTCTYWNSDLTWCNDADSGPSSLIQTYSEVCDEYLAPDDSSKEFLNRTWHRALGRISFHRSSRPLLRHSIIMCTARFHSRLYCWGYIIVTLTLSIAHVAAATTVAIVRAAATENVIIGTWVLSCNDGQVRNICNDVSNWVYYQRHSRN